LSLTNGGQVSVDIDRFGLGESNQGKIDITATGDITIDGSSSDGFSGNSIFDNSNSSIRSSVDGPGNAEGINISTTNLSLTNGGQVSADIGQFIPSEGNQGKVDITATGDITIDGSSVNDLFSNTSFTGNSNSSIRSSVDGEGNAGGIKLSTTNLSLTNGGQVSASTSGIGDLGAIDITARGDITVDGNSSISSISSSTILEETGKAEGINLSTNNFNLTNGGEVLASTLGEGDLGEVNITARGDITIDGNSSISSISGGNPIFDDSIVFEETGKAEGINLSTNNLNLTNGGEVSAETTGGANAGDLDINVTNILKVEGEDSGLFSRTGGTGDAGTLNINAAQLQVNNNAQVGVNNFIETQLRQETVTDSSGRSITRIVRVFEPIEGVGNAGTLEINADTIRLENGGNLTAISGGGDGGDIDIDSNLLVLNDGGKVAAEAALRDTPGSGGNINIDSTLIAAFPDENNDITANAFSEIAGIGGNITIATEGIFGIEERALNDFTNDINASSARGAQFDGTVAITIPDINAIQTETQVPNNLIESEQTTEQACQSDRINAAKNGLNILGKGGIPPEAIEPLQADNIIIDQKFVANYIPPEIKPIETDNGDIYPARGIIKTADGGIILTAYPTENIPTRTPIIKPNCNYSNSYSHEVQ
jgi:large exoprotein involved in heme utilization and adhesion